jgi:2-amino-4-hydroxy-6-hydroxymethyldihydropteridine diphosphokinase
MTSRRDHVAALSLGGNVGDVATAFREALNAFERHRDVKIVARSQVWRTPPWGKTDQPDFLNMAVLLNTSLAPLQLLALCQQIEATGGREREERWGPRTLDIDIIAIDDLVLDDETLTLPHPRARERAFVLIPLAEIAGDTMLGSECVSDLAEASERADMRIDEDATLRVSA